MWFMSIQSVYFCEPLKVGHLPFLFLGANVAKIIRCVSLQSWSFFLSHCKFYSVFSRKRFTWPGLFRTWLIFSDWFLHVAFSRFQYSNLQFGSLLHSFINCLCYWAFVCKGFLPLTFAIHLQRTTVRPCIKLFIWFLPYVHKGRGHYLPVPLQRTLSLFPVLFTKGAVLVFCYSFAKDHSPCVVVFILKGPLSFSLLFICKGRCPWICYSFAKDAVLVWCYLFAKDRRPCLMLFICKGRRPCLMLFIYKGPRYLFCAISLQRKTAAPAIHSLSRQDKMDRNSSKAWGNCFPFRVCENGCYTN